MPYTLLKYLLWLIIALLLGLILGYLLWGRRKTTVSTSTSVEVEAERLRGRVANLEASVADKKKLQAEVEELRAAKAAAAAIPAGIPEADHDVIVGERNHFQGLVAQHESSLGDLRKQLDAQTAATAAAEAAAAAIPRGVPQADHDAVAGERDHLQGLVDQHQASLASLQTNHDAVVGERDHLQGLVTQHQTSLGDLRNQLDTQTAATAAAEAAAAAVPRGVPQSDHDAIVTERNRLQGLVTQHETSLGDVRNQLNAAAAIPRGVPQSDHDTVVTERNRLRGLVDQHEATIGDLQGQLHAHSSVPAPPVTDVSGGEAVLGRKVKLDDLKLVEGIGPKIEELIHATGVTTWWGLANTQTAALRTMLDAAGPRFQMHDPGSWPQQARLLAEAKWAEFKALTDALSGGKVSD